MSFVFSTNGRQRALGFLREMYPGCTVEDSEESAAPVLDLVAEGLCRIQDPKMHQPPRMYATEAASNEDVERVLAAGKTMHEAIMATCNDGEET